MLLPQELQDRLLFVWGQEECTAVEVDHDTTEHGKPVARTKEGVKVIYRKDLNRIWNCYPQFNQENTLMIDDSKEKFQDEAPCFRHVQTWTKNEPERRATELLLSMLDRCTI